MRARWLLTPSLQGLIVAFQATVVTFVVPLKADDVFWHLKAGDLILQTGAIPRTNGFSFTAPDAPWVAHEWLAEVLFAWVFRHGPSLLPLLAVGLQVAALALLARLAFREPRAPVASAVLTLFAGFFLLANWSIRPYLLGNLFLLLALWLVDLEPRRARSIALFALFVVWANVHGSWLVGLGVLGLWALGATLRGDERLGRRWGELLLATGACLLTPSHVHGLVFPLQYLASPLWGEPGFLEEILEWQRVPLASPLGQLLLSAVVLASMVVFASRQPPKVEGAVLFLVFSLAAFSAVRNAPLIGVALVVLLPPHLAVLCGRIKGRVGRALERAAEVDRQASRLLPLGAWAVAVWVSFTAPVARTPDFFPVELVTYLSSRPAPTRLFHPFNWGGALLFAGQRVFIDQRNDCYPPEVWRDYLTVHHLRPGWEAVLDRWHIDAIAWSRAAPLTQELRGHPGWRLEHEDPDAVLFSRQPR